ncbi:MAG: hypothetical protein ACMXYD_00175 [Candidatus Woesearchaeota archaeon]
MAKKSSAKKKGSEDRSGLFIPAGIMLGIGVGFLLDALIASLFIGLGLGFAAMALTKQ